MKMAKWSKIILLGIVSTVAFQPTITNFVNTQALAPQSGETAAKQIPYAESDRFSAFFDILRAGVHVGALDQGSLDENMKTKTDETAAPEENQRRREKSAHQRLIIAQHLLRHGIPAILLNWNTVRYMRAKAPKELQIPTQNVVLRIEGGAQAKPGKENVFLDPKIEFFGEELSNKVTEAIENDQVELVVPEIAARLKQIKEETGITKFKINVYWNWALPEYRSLSEFQLKFIEALGQASELADVWLVSESLYFDYTGDKSAVKADGTPDEIRQAAYSRRLGENAVIAFDKMSRVKGVALVKSEFPGSLKDREEAISNLREMAKIARRKPWAQLSAGVEFEEFRTIMGLSLEVGHAIGAVAGRSYFKQAIDLQTGDLKLGTLDQMVGERVPQINGLMKSPAIAGGAAKFVRLTNQQRGAAAGDRLLQHYGKTFYTGTLLAFGVAGQDEKFQAEAAELAL